MLIKFTKVYLHFYLEKINCYSNQYFPFFKAFESLTVFLTHASYIHHVHIFMN